MMQYTLWYRPELKPVRVGTYETKIFIGGETPVETSGYSHWNGLTWSYQMKQQHVAELYKGHCSNQQHKSWRGLTARAE